jgi:amidase
MTKTTVIPVSRRKFLGSMSAVAAGVTLAGKLSAHWTPPAMSWEEWAGYDALELADLVRSGKISALEVAEQTEHAVHKVNPMLNAVLEFYYDKLKPGASDNLPNGIFHGVPYFFKDVGAVEKGRVAENGSLRQLGHIVEEDSEYITKIRRSGLNFLGRTAAPEEGTSPVTESLMNGYTHNPWKPGFTPGGSSGGAGSAVAAGILPMSASNDGGGSTRIPASLCGNVGLKHSRSIANALEGRNDPMSLVSSGVNSRTVRDTAAFLDAALNPEATNANPGAEGSYLAALEGRTGPLKIAVSSGQWGPYNADADALAEMRRIAGVLKEMGHTVDEVDANIDYQDFYKAFQVFWTATAKARMTPEEYEKIKGDLPEEDFSKVEPITALVYGGGKKWTYDDFQWAIGVNRVCTHAVDDLLANWDFWLTPTVAQHTPRVGSNIALSYGHQAIDEWWFNAFGFIPYTPLTNFSGHPSISLPLANFASGMPLGAHFIGAKMSEANMLSLSAQLEKALPWAEKRPEIHVTNS